MFIVVNGQRHPLPGPQTLAALLLSLSPPAPLAVYYGADYFGRNLFPDTTNTTHPRTIIGFGGPGSPNNKNQAIQQAAFDWIQTFWSAPRYGAVQSYVQYSYLTRAPWFVAPGTPKNAHLSMVYAGFRYILPSTAGTLLRVPRPD
jgi:sulfur carrier protein ThiS